MHEVRRRTKTNEKANSTEANRFIFVSSPDAIVVLEIRWVKETSGEMERAIAGRWRPAMWPRHFVWQSVSPNKGNSPALLLGGLGWRWETADSTEGPEAAVPPL